MTRRRLWIERDYKSFKRTKQGEKLINIFRILAYNISTVKETKKITGYSRSEVRNLLILAKEHGYVHEYPTPRTRRRPGKPHIGEFEKDRGRPSIYYSLTAKGLFLMRFDPELMDRWKTVEAAYADAHEPNILDSYNNLKYAIQEHPVLSRFDKPYYFDGELQRTLLNPFLFKRGLNEEQVNELSDELARLINENVRPQHILNYASTLQDSVARLEKTIQRHKLLIEKIKSLKHQFEATL